MSNGFRMSKGKVAPFPNGINERRDSLESQDTLVRKKEKRIMEDDFMDDCRGLNLWERVIVL